MTTIERIERGKEKVSCAKFACCILLTAFIILLVSTIKSIEVCENNEIEDESNFTVYESEANDHNAETSSANASETTIETSNTLNEMTETVVQKFSRNIPDYDKYLLAKIAMAEAEGESIETKIYIILTVINRANYENKSFPNTIEEVIFQYDNNIYQFSPTMPGGRWWTVEPNEECWRAVEIVNEMKEDISMNALYFESCEGESWHSRNLEFIYQSGNVRFYK